MNNQTIREKIIQALNWRYATKIFDPTKKISDEDLHTILESGRLSPSSSGIEMWKFIVVNDTETRAKLREVSFDQPKVTDASHIIVIAYRTDAETNMIKERLERTAKIQNQKVEDLGGLKGILDMALKYKLDTNTLEPWIASQAYIPLGMMTETASLLDIDNCAMEGFIPSKVDEVLGLKEKNLKSVTMLALGHRGDDGASTRPKVRRPFEEVVEFV